MTAEEKAGQLVVGLDLCDCPHVAQEDCDGCRLKVAIAAAIREAEAAMKERAAKVADEFAERLWAKYKGRDGGPQSGRADPHDQGGSDYAEDIAAAIRALE